MEENLVSVNTAARRWLSPQTGIRLLSGISAVATPQRIILASERETKELNTMMLLPKRIMLCCRIILLKMEGRIKETFHSTRKIKKKKILAYIYGTLSVIKNCLV